MSQGATDFAQQFIILFPDVWLRDDVKLKTTFTRGMKGISEARSI
jgi:hypothetical protein